MEAKDLTRERFRALAFTSLAHLLNDSFLVTMSVLIDFYLDMSVPALYLGVMAALVNVLSGLASPVISSLADRRGWHNQLMLLGFSLIGTSSLLFAGAFIPVGVVRLALIGLGAVFLGLGLSFYHPLGGAILQYAYEGNAGPALGINGAFGSIGRALFPLMMVLAIKALGGGAGLSLIAVYVYALASVIYLGLRPFHMPHTGETRSQSASRLLAYYNALAPLTLVVFIRAMFMSGAMTYFPTYVDSIVHSKVLMGVIVTASYATAIVGQPFFGWLVGRIGGRNVIVITTIASTAFYIAFLLVRDLYLLTTLLAMYSFFAMSGFPVLLGYVSEVVGPEARAQANSLVWGVGNTVGGAVGIMVGGSLVSISRLTFMVTTTGLDAAMWSFAVFALISMALLILIPEGRSSRKALGHDKDVHLS
ncbi:MAG: MFS transporter [Acidilobus sp.]